MTVKRRGKDYAIRVRGQQRKTTDKHLLAQMLVSLGEQLQEEHQFLTWLLEQDRRLIGLTKGTRPFVLLADLPILGIEGGRLVCRLPLDQAKAAMVQYDRTPDGARLDRITDKGPTSVCVVSFPSDMTPVEWERWALAALEFAHSSQSR